MALLDIGMPDFSGHRVAQMLREAPWGRALCLIALTGWGQDEDKQKAFAAGFTAHVTKPIEIELLNEILMSIETRLEQT